MATKIVIQVQAKLLAFPTATCINGQTAETANDPPLHAVEHIAKALDYLLKPYTRDRFSIAVQKALNSLQNNLNSVQSLTESLLSPESTYPEKILVQIGAKLVTVDLAEVIWIDAEGDYSKLITSKQRYLSNYGLGALEKNSIHAASSGCTIRRSSIWLLSRKFKNKFPVMM